MVLGRCPEAALPLVPRRPLDLKAQADLFCAARGRPELLGVGKEAPMLPLVVFDSVMVSVVCQPGHAVVPSYLIKPSPTCDWEALSERRSASSSLDCAQRTLSLIMCCGRIPSVGGP